MTCCTRLAHAFSSSTPLTRQLGTVAWLRAGLVWRFSSCKFRMLKRPIAGGFLGQPLLVVRRQDLAGDRAVVSTTRRPTSACRSVSMRAWSCGGGFSRLGDDLLGGGDGLLVSCSCTRAAAARASSISLLAWVRLVQDFLARASVLASSCFDLLGVGQALRQFVDGAPRAHAESACRRSGGAGRPRCKS